MSIPDVSPELLALDALPELANTPFPYRGHRDFREFTQDDYDNFSAGVFQRTDQPSQLKWFGGKTTFEVAKRKLEELGYILRIKLPHMAEVGNTQDGYEKVRSEWYTINFVAKDVKWMKLAKDA